MVGLAGAAAQRAEYLRHHGASPEDYSYVETLPRSGKVGTAVKIREGEVVKMLGLGTGLTGATGVTFNGTPAAFIVKSKSEITTTVPVGATTGIVQVATPKDTLSSHVPFTVTP